MLRILFLLTLCVLTAFAGSAVAQTLDGETPANEGICDDLHGGTPGLYGLCVAYCEAQDLDGLDVSDPSTMLNKAPNSKLLQKYRSKMRDGDPDMPCVQTPCPCWTEEQIGEIAGRGRDIEFCVDVNFYDTEGHDDNTIEDVDLGWEFYTYALAQRVNPAIYPDLGYEASCIWLDWALDPVTGETLFEDFVVLNITSEEYGACAASIENRAAAAGLECYVFD